LQCTDAHGIDVDVSINDDRGIRAAHWLLRCQKQWPALRPLTLLLKAIMRVLELHDVSQGVYKLMS
jgi:DNA polymerase sigma